MMRNKGEDIQKQRIEKEETLKKKYREERNKC